MYKNVGTLLKHIYKLYNINDLELGITVKVIFNEGTINTDIVK